MAVSHQKSEVITFKADEALIDALEGVPNRSEFIRSAILNALDNAFPLWKGAGILTPHQERHWEEFTTDHGVAKCDECHEIHLVCNRETKRRRR